MIKVKNQMIPKITDAAKVPKGLVFVSPDGRTLYTRDNIFEDLEVGHKECACTDCDFRITLLDKDEQPYTFEVAAALCPVLIWVQRPTEMPAGVYRLPNSGDVYFPDEKGGTRCLKFANLEFLENPQQSDVAVAVQNPQKEVIVPIGNQYYRFPFNWVPVKRK